MNKDIISEIFRIRCNHIGKISNDQISCLTLKSVDIAPLVLETYEAAFDSFTKIAIIQIHRTYRGNPTISPEEARKTMKNCMFFLDDDAFEKFYEWASWCVAKGC